jgi:hypothetical protein
MTGVERLAGFVVDRSRDDAGAPTTPGGRMPAFRSEPLGPGVRKPWLTLQEQVGDERTH